VVDNNLNAELSRNFMSSVQISSASSADVRSSSSSRRRRRRSDRSISDNGVGDSSKLR